MMYSEKLMIFFLACDESHKIEFCVSICKSKLSFLAKCLNVCVVVFFFFYNNFTKLILFSDLVWTFSLSIICFL